MDYLCYLALFDQKVRVFNIELDTSKKIPNFSQV
jgi:hypothetical protein